MGVQSYQVQIHRIWEHSEYTQRMCCVQNLKDTQNEIILVPLPSFCFSIPPLCKVSTPTDPINSLSGGRPFDHIHRSGEAVPPDVQDKLATSLRL